MSHDAQRRFSLAMLLGLLLSLLALPAAPRAYASDIANPTAVTIAGSLQSELGCPGDWQPDCAATQLGYDAEDDVWQGSLAVPAGSWEYKAPLNNSWDVNYGANAALNGPNIGLSADGSPVKFYYDHKSHWVTSNRNARIITAPGNFQSELGCSGDWDPSCLRSWLQDPDGDGTYTLSTEAIPAGSYFAKAAVNESWDVNYGQGGAQNGADIPFTVETNEATVNFSFVSATNTLSIEVVEVVGPPPGPGLDNDIFWDGLRHDSRDSLYRTPGGAVPAGTPVTIRFRTYHNDVSAVTLRVFDVNAGGQRLVPMLPAATDVDCYQDLPYSCDFWEATIVQAEPNNLWYRFIISDGSKTVYYGDNTGAFDGGLGATTENVVDISYALMYYQPGFSAPAWARSAVIYQIFPDRFRNGLRSNDPRNGDIRYDDPVIALPWGTLPEGHCRHYADAATNCPWRYDDTPPEWSPTIEGPRGRDYYGGDLQGVIEKLDYLEDLGVTTIYFNPIFDAGSNHRYDTQDYTRIDPALGTNGTFTSLVNRARQRDINIVLDNVFNHMSSDSPLFDRYGYYRTLGACESLDSPYRAWFNFRTENVPCGSADYVGWFGFDSIPEIDKNNPEVVDYFVTGRNSIARYWLKRGAEGWRLDVMGDASFPFSYWQTFREVTRETKGSSLIIGELWQKDTTLLRHLRGQTADTTMNYRLRDAILGLLAPQAFDAKGFGDSGRIISPEEFANRVLAIREDYPDAAYYSLMNLLGSHDTERVLWTLTPGAETIAERELNAANLAEGKQRLRLASLIQFTMPGAPTVYYGDEVGVTGDDDPDDRRTYPWADTGGSPDTSLLGHYQRLAELREDSPALIDGDLRVLLADNAADVVAYSRVASNRGALVLINRSSSAQTVSVPTAGVFPNNTVFRMSYGVGGSTPARVTSGGVLQVTVPALGGFVLETVRADLTAPAAPGGLAVTAEGQGQVSLSWNSVAGAASYTLFRSPLSGGGWVAVATVAGTSHTDTGLENGRTYYYAVAANDAVGNQSQPSAEVAALPAYQIGWANLQWPPTIDYTVSAANRTPDIYGQVWIDGVTNEPGPTASLRAQVGFGPQGSDPAGAGWAWEDASFNGQAGNNDEFVASLRPEAAGAFDYVYRYSTNQGRSWLYADLSGPVPAGALPANPGRLTVSASGDTTAPSVPTGLAVQSASPDGIALSWNAASDETAFYGYEVARSTTAGGPYSVIAQTTATSYTDTAIAEGVTYYYVVRALDDSFNRSGYSAEVAATAELRTVTVTFRVTAPAGTPADGVVHIAGRLDLLDGGLPQWQSDGVALSQVGPNSWEITLTGTEGVSIEYKYTLGAPNFLNVEKGDACDEIANRLLTLTYGSSGVMTVNESVANWRNVAPCGN